ncbi:unnamed protein product [Prorocentrum cordatum]|uniref:Uncharacterized protein n=1 Tax=Prorocentrum cordatum TaxID=2364126 RepID=A0ABN9TJ71_9DINO|nr:unnamed protein product [Polarella glacialis]
MGPRGSHLRRAPQGFRKAATASSRLAQLGGAGDEKKQQITVAAEGEGGGPLGRMPVPGSLTLAPARPRRSGQPLDRHRASAQHGPAHSAPLLVFVLQLVL